MVDAKANPAVTAVHAIQTGSAKQHPEHRYGTRKPLMWWVLTSRRWVQLPLLAYAIEHRDGLVLFDTGADPALVSDPRYIDSAVGRFLKDRIFRFHITPEDGIASRLRAHGLRAADVERALISHLHFDHVGGIAAIPQAQLLVHEDEWRRLSEPEPEKDWILREHIELPSARWCPTSFEPTDDPLLAGFGTCHDVMGDGSLVLLPTPGHSAGSMSLLVRSSNLPPLLMVGDLTYETDLLLNDQLPGIGDAELLKASYAKVRALKEALPELLILPSHDPRAAERLAACQPHPLHSSVAATGPAAPRLSRAAP